jgi:ribosome biogenesis SPOUT family RNA methylase Rps3
MSKHIFIIEHLEPKMWKWCLMEYEHISKIVGKQNLIFTNIKRPTPRLAPFGRIYKRSVRDLDLDLREVCVLDPDAPTELSPSDSKRYKYYVFGGILGDYPPKKRTKRELTPFLNGAGVRNLGKRQMATDNAIYVTKKIIEGTPLSEIPFLSKAVIQKNKIESTELPFRYVSVGGKPLMSAKVVTYLKRKRGF